MTMKKTVLVEVIVFFVLSLLAISEGMRLVFDRDPNVIYDMLGPGYYILFIGICLALLGITHFIINYRKANNFQEEIANKKINISVFGTVLALAIYILLLTYVGYILASFVFIMLELRLLGNRSWLANTIISISLTVLFYVLFVRLCGMIFPIGILF
jgi:NADH:ubiquinone oxidoreductase subunit 6 (subunit J)